MIIKLNVITKNYKNALNNQDCITKKSFLKISINDNIYEIPIDKMKKTKILVAEKTSFNKNTIMKNFVFNDVKYYIYTDEFANIYITSNFNKFLKIRQRFLCFSFFKKIIFIGIMLDISKRVKGFDEVYLNKNFLGKIKRPLKFSVFKNIAVIKINYKDIINSNFIHNKISIGKKGLKLMPIRYYRRNENHPIDYYLKRKYLDKIIIVRSTINDRNVIITKIERTEEYYPLNLLKMHIARILSEFLKHKKINLFFEKESSQAQESGYHVFATIMNNKKELKINSINYFILNKKSEKYKELKLKYGKNLVAKYSLKHYILIFASKYFIASELSNHVLNPRLYIPQINQKIKTKPLIFLQHGIMFAKPVENPAASGFYKNNKGINIHKAVISSELEATQFYKMGYERSDLIKSGIPKFDISKMNEDADKIMFMPTYRFWEESEITSPEKIKETTYFKLFIRIIEAFEEANLLDKLIISSHPKFSEYISSSIPKYSNLIEKDINKALEQSKIFITDYSSASYDSHHRGACIIYYWEEKDYLIEKYQATPPINETNCDGPVVYSTKQLITEVKKIIKKNYKVPKIYEERFKKINEYSDNKNTERLIHELMKNNII